MRISLFSLFLCVYIIILYTFFLLENFETLRTLKHTLFFEGTERRRRRERKRKEWERKKRKGIKRKGRERKGEERKGKESKGKEIKGMERK